MLSELIDTAPGFRAAVNLQQAQNDVEKAAAFLPTAQTAEVLFDFARQLEPRARERARLITGSYGTGKSHLALVLTMCYRGRQEAVARVLDRLAEKYPGRADQLRERLATISQQAPYLVVLIEGDQDSFDAALIRGLRQALDHAGLADYMPATYFSAAAQRLRELLGNQDSAGRTEQAARQFGYDSALALAERLDSRAAELKDLENFNRLHEQVCFGAPFLADTHLKATETYQDAVRTLVQEGRFAGITVIWDEFGAFMEQLVKEPTSAGGQAVQRFAEACQDSGEHPLHLYLVTHRSLQSYVRRARSTQYLTATQAAEWEEDFKKISGRFNEFFIESQPDELYSLIDGVLIQRVSDGWAEFAQQRTEEFDMLAESAYQAELFEHMAYRELRATVVEGCYPLAPATAAMLPHISRIVAQNQRTLFTFLCGDHPGTVAHFLQQTPVPNSDEPLPLVTCDALWDYFQQAIEDDRVGQAVYRRYRAALANSSLKPDDTLGLRLLKVIALFDLVREGYPEGAPTLSAREETLALALDLRSESSREKLRKRLDQCTQRGPTRVAVRDREGVYRLITGTGTELSEAVEQMMAQRQPLLSVGGFLRGRWGTRASSAGQLMLGFKESIEALADVPDVVSRTVEVQVLMPEEIDNLNHWLRDIGGGEFKDGLLLLVLPTDDPHVGMISKLALQLADNPQVILARPPHALRGLRGLVARLDALEEVARQEATFWGPQGERRDEWEAEYQDAEHQLEELLKAVALSDNAAELALDCFWQGSPVHCKSWGELRTLADRAMSTAFALTPKTAEEIMKSTKKNDGLKAARRVVVDKLLDARALRALVDEKDQAQARLVRLLQTFDMLKTPKPQVGRPDPEKNPGAAAVWDYLQDFADELRDAPKEAQELVRSLRSAPYGLGERVLPLVVAAALRDRLRSGNIVAERRGRGDQWQAVPITGEVLDELLINKPDGARLRYVEVAEWQVAAVEALIETLVGAAAVPEERSRLFDEAKNQVAMWWGGLPHYGQQTQKLSEAAIWLRDEILRPLVHPSADAYEVLVERLSKKMGDVASWDRTRFAREFGKLIGELEAAVDGLPQLVAAELREGLKLECEPDPDAVVAALRDWYAQCPEQTRDYCHQSDAGKLQSWLRTDGADLPSLCETITGRPLRDWSDADVGHFVGRVQSAQRFIEEWTPPPPSPTEVAAPPQAPGLATVTVSASYKSKPVHLTRSFPLVEEGELSETAKVVLRLLTVNLAEDQALRDGERENVLLLLIRRLFGDG